MQLNLPEAAPSAALGGLPNLSPADQVELALLRLPDEAFESWEKAYVGPSRVERDRLDRWEQELDDMWG